MKRRANRPSRRIAPSGSRSWRGAVALGIATLLPLACAGESGSSSAAATRGSEPGDTVTADRSAAGASAPESTSHSHDGGPAHSHGTDTHTHAATDTLDVVPLAGPGGGAPSGTVTVLALGDTLRLHVVLDEAEPGSRYSPRLVAGNCAEPGDELAELTPVMAGSSGRGSSQTALAPDRTAGHAHGAVRLLPASGPSVGCASVHLAGAHEHGGE